MQLVYGLVKDDVCLYASSTDCCTMQSNDAHIDPDLVLLVVVAVLSCCMYTLLFFSLHMSHNYCKRAYNNKCKVLGTPDPAKKCSTKNTYTVGSLA